MNLEVHGRVELDHAEATGPGRQELDSEEVEARRLRRGQGEVQGDGRGLVTTGCAQRDVGAPLARRSDPLGSADTVPFATTMRRRSRAGGSALGEDAGSAEPGRGSVSSACSSSARSWRRTTSRPAPEPRFRAAGKSGRATLRRSIRASADAAARRRMRAVRGLSCAASSAAEPFRTDAASAGRSAPRGPPRRRRAGRGRQPPSAMSPRTSVSASRGDISSERAVPPRAAGPGSWRSAGGRRSHASP